MKNYKINIGVAGLVLLSCFQLSAQDAGEKATTLLARQERTQAIKINLVSPFYGTVNLAWQKVISPEASFQLTASYTDFDSYGSTADVAPDPYGQSGTVTNGIYTINSYTYNTVKNQRTQGLTVMPEYRYNLNGRGLTGFYIAPFTRYMYYEYSRELEKRVEETVYNTQTNTQVSYTRYTAEGSDLYTYHSLGFGVTVGKQTMFKNKIVIDLFAGPCYSFVLASNINVNATSDVVIGSGIPNLYVRGYGVRAGFTIGLAY
jgi:hypothetical protein